MDDSRTDKTSELPISINGKESIQVKDPTGSPTTPGTNSKAEKNVSLKYVSLVTLTLQNVLLILVMRYVRVREGDMFMSTTAVVMAELLKFLSCLLIIFAQEGYRIDLWAKHLNENIFQQPMDCLKIAVPSIIYTIQNNLLYVAVSNLEAAVFQVTYQLKILTTALFSVFLLRKEISRLQWLALVILFVGVSCVSLQKDDGGSKSSTVATEQNPLLGLVAVIISCLMSGFAGVYFEKILKGTKQTIWLRNVQLGFIGIIFGLATVGFKDYNTVQEKGFFFGYDIVVWVVIGLSSFGGLMVAVVVKYADNILKGFATSAAIVVSCVVSIYLFDFQVTMPFATGAGLVILSTYMYAKYAPQPTLPK